MFFFKIQNLNFINSTFSCTSKKEYRRRYYSFYTAMSFKGCFELFLKINLFQKNLYIRSGIWHNFLFSQKNHRSDSTFSCTSRLESRCQQHRIDNKMSSKKCFEPFLKNKFQKIHMLDQVLGTILFYLKKIIEVTVLPVPPPNWNLGVGRTVFTMK